MPHSFLKIIRVIVCLHDYLAQGMYRVVHLVKDNLLLTLQ